MIELSAIFLCLVAVWGVSFSSIPFPYRLMIVVFAVALFRLAFA